MCLHNKMCASMLTEMKVLTEEDIGGALVVEFLS